MANKMGGKNQKRYTAPPPSSYSGPGGGQGTKMRPEIKKLIAKSEKINPIDFIKKGLPESTTFTPNRPERSYRNRTYERDGIVYESKPRDSIPGALVRNYMPDLGPPKILVDGIIRTMDYLEKRKKKK